MSRCVWGCEVISQALAYFVPALQSLSEDHVSEVLGPTGEAT